MKYVKKINVSSKESSISCDIMKINQELKGAKYMKLYLKQRVLSLADRYNFYDENKNIKYKSIPKLFSIRHKMKLVDIDDNFKFFIQKRLFRFKRTYVVLDQDKNVVAKVSKNLITFTNRMKVETSFGQMDLKGNIFAFNFNLTDQDNNLKFSVAKKIFAIGDSYELDIVDEKNLELWLAVIIIIDAIVHNKKRNNDN